MQSQDVDPELYKGKVLYLQRKQYRRDGLTLEGIGLTFTDEVCPGKVVELLPGGAELKVTEENVGAYVKNFVQHRLVKSVEPQLAAFKRGLTAFPDMQHSASAKICATIWPHELQLLVSGEQVIDVADWEAHTDIHASLKDPETGQPAADVAFFWANLRSFTAENKAKLLYFATGSGRLPAAGFGRLPGFNGGIKRFELQRAPAGSAADSLPLASTCLKTVKLPPYSCAAEQRAKLLTAMYMGTVGFDERGARGQGANLDEDELGDAAAIAAAATAAARFGSAGDGGSGGSSDDSDDAMDPSSDSRIFR
eukprot:SAG22_NODE_456_length_10273_cov_3.463436_5_plen_309_part_00